MISLSRRQLARYAVDELMARTKPNLIAKHLAAALITSKKAAQADLLIDDIAWELESRGELAQATLVSAHALSTGLKKSLAAQIKKAAQVKKVVLNEQVDEDVLGGVRIETAAHTWDRTVRKMLNEIKGGI